VHSLKSFVSVVCVAAAVAAPGCGSGGDSAATSGTTAKPMTKAAYVEAAEKICRETAKKAPAFPGEKDKGGGYKTTAAKVIPYLQTIRQLAASSLSRIAHLEPPAADKANARSLIAAQRARIKGLNDALTAAQNGDGTAFTAAFQRDQNTNGPRYAQAATALGLKGCSL
jgi:hypothetical protein